MLRLLVPSRAWGAARVSGTCRARFAHTQSSAPSGQALSIQKMSMAEWAEEFKKVR